MLKSNFYTKSLVFYADLALLYSAWEAFLRSWDGLRKKFRVFNFSHIIMKFFLRKLHALLQLFTVDCDHILCHSCEKRFFMFQTTLKKARLSCGMKELDQARLGRQIALKIVWLIVSDKNILVR